MFSIERTFKHFNRLSFDLLGLRSLPYGGVKFGYSYKHALLFSFHAVEWLPRWQDWCSRALRELRSNYLLHVASAQKRLYKTTLGYSTANQSTYFHHSRSQTVSKDKPNEQALRWSSESIVSHIWCYRTIYRHGICFCVFLKLFIYFLQFRVAYISFGISVCNFLTEKCQISPQEIIQSGPKNGTKFMAA